MSLFQAADNSVPDDSFIMFDNDELKPIKMKPQVIVSLYYSVGLL